MIKPILETSLLMACAAAQAQDVAAQLEHVRLDLRPDFTQRRIDGQALLSLRTSRGGDELRLDAARLDIHRISLAGRSLRFDYDGSAADGALRVRLPRPQKAGAALQLRIRYSAARDNASDPANIWGSTGLGVRWFAPTLTDPRKRQQLWASGEPRSARYWFPGIDRPDQWHHSDLIATVPEPMQVFSAGRLVSVRALPGGQRRYHWRAEAPHRSQQLLFIVGRYAELPSPHAQVALRSHGYPHEMDGVAASVPRLPDTVDFFSRLLASPFPAAEYRQVFVPDFPWGQYGPGLSMLSENMVDDVGTHADFLYLWNVLQAEGVAAQWFGVRRGAGSLRDLWLDRALPRHLGGYYSASRNGHDEFMLYTLQPDQATALASTATLELPPDASPEQLQAPQLAARGHVVLHMLRRQIGDDAWRQVLRELAAGQGPLSREMLQVAAQRAAGRPLGWFFEQWLPRGGHPVFEVSSHFEAGSGWQLLLRQTQDGGFYAGHVDLEVDGRLHRVWLEAKAENRIVLPLLEPPRQVQIDRDGGWLMELRHEQPTPALLRQLARSTDALTRRWTQQQLVARAKAAPADAPAIQAALQDLVLRQDLAWRARWQALGALRQLHAGPPDPRLTEMLLRLVHDERSWLRAQGLHGLGELRDPRRGPLYLEMLQEPSDRVVTAAAIALGKSVHPQAFEALSRLPLRPSWKNQSLIAALNGLAELKDPRGIAIAEAALANTEGERWTLATPVWDHRLAAADTLRQLGAGERGVPLLLRHLDDALAQGHVNDSLYNLQLLVALGAPQARAALARTRARFSDHPGMAAAIQQHEDQLAKLLESR